MSTYKPVIGLTMGDPAGIGPEITAKAAADDAVRAAADIVILGDYDHLTGIAED